MMPLPLNIQVFLDTVRGRRSPITASDLNDEELAALRYAIKKRQDYNSGREFSIRNSLYDTPQEYRRGPETSMQPEKPGSSRLVPKDISYTDRQARLQQQLDTYDRTRNKTSVSYGDYGVKSGEDAAPVGQGWASAISQSMNDPAFRLAGTLGSFNATDMGDHYQVDDTYKFNRDQQGFYRDADKQPLHKIVGQYYDRPGSLGEILFRKYLGDRSRKVDIKLQK